MGKQLLQVSFALVAGFFGTWVRAEAAIPYRVTPRVVAFDSRDVTLLDGPFQQAQNAQAAYLLSIRPERLLSNYRTAANLEPKAEPYGGWEGQGLAGHSLGHYLSACTRMYHATGDTEFRQRVDLIVAELAECQQAASDGFLGGMPRGREIFAEVASGEIRSAGFDLNGSWVPWYNLHKLLAGLLDAHEFCDNAQALAVASGIGDWAARTTAALTPEQWQLMLACEHGGMNESLAELYRRTGKAIYLELARKFYHRAILDPLAAERDELSGKHSNTQIPKIIGVAKLWELTGEERYATIARFFWQTMIGSHTYVIGGNSLGEHLGPPGKLNDRLGSNTAETCNTYNMLKLTSTLFSHEQRAEYADYMERALWNHILASQNPADGMVCYFVPLAAGSKKPFMQPEDFTCCTGSGMENHARYGEYLYSRSADDLFVNQFISSTLRWREREVTLHQHSALPNTGGSRLELSSAEPQEFALHLRWPEWCATGFGIRINGELAELAGHSGSFVSIRRMWHDGDVVDIEMPLRWRQETMPDNPQRVALFYGPLLHVGILSEDIGSMNPVLVTGGHEPADWIVATKSLPPQFRTARVGRPKDVALMPFFAVQPQRYIVYWDLFSDQQWQAKQDEYEAERQRQAELESRTIDRFAIGEMQPEREHHVTGEKSGVGDFGGRKFRHAWDGGWFAFEVTVPKDEPADLIVTYWGGETGPRNFTILANDKPMASQSLQMDRPGEFWDQTYELPAEACTSGTLSVRFQAEPRNTAGGVFGIRVVKREAATP